MFDFFINRWIIKKNIKSQLNKNKKHMTNNYECKRKNNKQMKKMMNEQKRILLLFNLKINAWIIKKY